MNSINNIKFSLRWIGILLIAGAIGLTFFVLGKKVPEIDSKISAVKAEADSLKQTEDNLSNLLANMEKYRLETQQKEELTEEILDEFPTFMYLEDKILFVDNLLNDKNGLGNYTIEDFNYGSSNYVTSVQVSENVTLELYSVSLGGTYKEAAYTDVKSLINYGFGSENRFVLKSITMAYDEETGYLRGDLNFTTYFMPGQPDPYKFPDEIIYELGETNRVDDLFGDMGRTGNESELMEGEVSEVTGEEPTLENPEVITN